MTKLGFSAVEYVFLEQRAKMGEDVVALSEDHTVIMHMQSGGTSTNPETEPTDVRRMEQKCLEYVIGSEYVTVNRRALITMLQAMDSERVTITVRQDHPVCVNTVGPDGDVRCRGFIAPYDNVRRRWGLEDRWGVE